MTKPVVQPADSLESKGFSEDLSAPEAAKMLRDTSDQTGVYAASLTELKMINGLSSASDSVALIESIAATGDASEFELGKAIVGFYLDATENANAISQSVNSLVQNDRGRMNLRTVATARRYEDSARFMASGQMMDYNFFMDYNDPEINQSYLALLHSRPADELSGILESIAEDEQKRAAFWSLHITGFDNGNTLQRGLIDSASDELQAYLLDTFGGKHG